MAYHYYIVDHDAVARVDEKTLKGEMLGRDGKWRDADAMRICNDGYEVSKKEALSWYAENPD